MAILVGGVMIPDDTSNRRQGTSIMMTRQESYRKGYPKALWNRCALPESRVVKVNADLLAVEPLPIYIAITNPFKLGLREEAGGWQKNARLDP
jgi:hypothetical protein